LQLSSATQTNHTAPPIPVAVPPTTTGANESEWADDD
jgi:hypothetical protein